MSKKPCWDVIALSSQHSEHTDFFSFSSTNSVTKILYLGYLFACARGFALQIRPAGLPAGYSYTLAPGKKKHPSFAVTEPIKRWMCCC